MEAVLGLIPDERPGPVEDVLTDLLAHVRRQAVHRDHIAARQREELAVELEPLQVEQPLAAASIRAASTTALDGS